MKATGAVFLGTVRSGASSLLLATVALKRLLQRDPELVAVLAAIGSSPSLTQRFPQLLRRVRARF